MSNESGSDFGGSDQILLCWSDATRATSGEQLVEVVQVGFSEAILKSDCEVPVTSKVRLVGNHYKADGTIRSCQKQGLSFNLGVSINHQIEPEVQPGTFDPGILSVEDFITEEQEAEILKDVAGDAPATNFIRAFSFSYA